MILRKRGIASAHKKSARVTKQGLIGSYIHSGGQLGVLVEVNCESDFVARTADFQELVHDIAMHIAAADPRYIRKEDVPGDALDKEREIQRGRDAVRRQTRQRHRPHRRRAPGESSTKRCACSSSPSSRKPPSPSAS